MRHFIKGTIKLIKKPINLKDAQEYLAKTNSESWANEVVKNKTVNHLDIYQAKIDGYGGSILIDYTILGNEEQEVKDNAKLFKLQTKDHFGCDILVSGEAIGHTKE